MVKLRSLVWQLALLASLANSASLVSFDSACSTSPVQTLQILTSTRIPAIAFQAPSASAVQIQRLSLCLGGGAFTGSLTVALYTTDASSPYRPLQQWLAPPPPPAASL